MQYTSHYLSPLGGILLASDGKALTGLWFDGQKYFACSLTPVHEEKPLPVFAETKKWLDIYFLGKAPDFTPLLRFEATPFRQAVQNNTRNYYWTGTLTTTKGTTCEFGNKDILKGSGYITNRCSGDNEIELGSVYSAELGITLLSDIDRYTVYGAELRLFFHLELADGTFETVPMGIFEVAEANRSARRLELKAYDYMSSLAQEESRSISENVTWGQRKRFSDGKVSMPYKRFLGYEKGENGLPVVNEEEAAVVRLIYRLFLEGKTSVGIGKYLEGLNIPSPSGLCKWSKTTVDSILTNEKYKGDALLQKKFTVDFLQKKMKPNEGEVPQYYVEGSHQAIVEPDEWAQVQTEFARRKQLGRAYSGKSVLSTKLVCADCGGYYGQKVWHSTDQYRRVIWQCNSKFENEKKCGTPVLDTSTIQGDPYRV